LDVTQNKLLTYLLCSDNKLNSLDVTNNIALLGLSCYNNPLGNLDVSKNTNLKNLQCYNNNLTSLDVTNNNLLTDLYTHENQLTSINLSKNTKLGWLYCSNNQLLSLDLSQCPNLKWISAGYQTITLNQKNASNGKLSISNPVSYNGTSVTQITPLPSGSFTNGVIIWDNLTEQVGNATFTFSTSLADGVSGSPFGGTVTQPWIASQTTPVDEHENEGITILSNKSSIVIEDIKANQMIWVYNITGKLLYHSPATSNRAVIDVPAGIYVVKIDNQTFKVIRY
jgi:hypothetical protein